jgi:hypothetical protein
VKRLKTGRKVVFKKARGGVVAVGGKAPRAKPRDAKGHFVAAPEVMKGPETRVYDDALTMAAGTYPESRFFNSSAALLGYIEGRPGVKQLLAVFPGVSTGGSHTPWTDAQRAEVRARLDASPPAEEKKTSFEGGIDYEEWASRLMQAIEWADDGGVLCEVEIDSESGAPE